MRTTPCAWSVLLGAGLALWATTLRQPSEQRIREVVDSCLRGEAATDRGVVAPIGGRETCVASLRAGGERGDAVYLVLIDSLFDRCTPDTAKTTLARVQSASAGEGKTESAKFELDLSGCEYISGLLLHELDGKWRIGHKVFVLR